MKKCSVGNRAFFLIRFTVMKRFVNPEESAGIGHYLVVILILIFGLFFLGSIPLAIVTSLRSSAFMNGNQQDFLETFTKNELFTLNMIPFVLALIVLFIGVKYILKRPFKTLFTVRKRFDFRRFFFSWILWTLILGVLFLISLEDNSRSIIWNYQPDKFWTLLILTLILTPIQTGLEELVFRGLLMQLFGKVFRKGIWIILVTGLLFGAIHLGNPEVLSVGWFAIFFYFMSGFFTALIVIMDDGLELPWGFHAANNFFGILIVTNNWQVLKTDALFLDTSRPEAAWDLVFILGVFYPIMLFVFAKLFAWNNWKARLFGGQANPLKN